MPLGECFIAVDSSNPFSRNAQSVPSVSSSESPYHARLTIEVFYDRNQNLIKDNDEDFLPGWEIKITANGVMSFIHTDVYGQVIKPLKQGHCVIELLPQEGWTNTTPSRQEIALGYDDSKSILFGVRPADSALQLMVFDDTNANGYKDRGEIGLSGWKMTIEGSEGANNITTNDSGQSIILVTPGSYHINLIRKEGWNSTTNSELFITTLSNEKLYLKFGEKPIIADNLESETVVNKTNKPQIAYSKNETKKVPGFSFLNIMLILIIFTIFKIRLTGER